MGKKVPLKDGNLLSQNQLLKILAYPRIRLPFYVIQMQKPFFGGQKPVVL